MLVSDLDNSMRTYRQIYLIGFCSVDNFKTRLNQTCGNYRQERSQENSNGKHNAATAIHDIEIAICGMTDERVAENIPPSCVKLGLNEKGCAICVIAKK